MNDTLANITKTLLGNSDEEMEFFFLLLLGFLPKWSYPHPSPTSMHKNGKQKNFQKSENLIYLKERSQLCVPDAQPLLTRRRDEY